MSLLILVRTRRGRIRGHDVMCWHKITAADHFM